MRACAVAALQLVEFLKIYISQGSASKHFGCGEIFKESFIANSLPSVSVKEFSKSINNWRRYGQKLSGTCCDG